LVGVFLVGGLGTAGSVGLFVKRVEHAFFRADLGLEIDFVAGFGGIGGGYFSEEDVVTDFAFEATFGDEAAVGLGVNPGRLPASGSPLGLPS